jgi:hypothetical protein
LKCAYQSLHSNGRGADNSEPIVECVAQQQAANVRLLLRACFEVSAFPQLPHGANTSQYFEHPTKAKIAIRQRRGFPMRYMRRKLLFNLFSFISSLSVFYFYVLTGPYAAFFVKLSIILPRDE